MKKRGWIILSSVVLLLAGIFAFYLYSTKTLIPKSEYNIALEKFLEEHQFQDGDLILRRGKSFESFAVLMSDREGEYSHIGLISIKGEEPWVVHASPESKSETGTPLLFEPLKTFLSYEMAREYAHYGVNAKNSEQGKKAAQAALESFSRRTQFDYEYNMNEDSALYCTELIHYTYKHADIDLCPQGFDTVHYLGREQVLLFPSTLVKGSKYFSLK